MLDWSSFWYLRETANIVQHKGCNSVVTSRQSVNQRRMVIPHDHCAFPPAVHLQQSTVLYLAGIYDDHLLLGSHFADTKVFHLSSRWQSHSMCKLFHLWRFKSFGIWCYAVSFVIPYVFKQHIASIFRVSSLSSRTVWPWRWGHYSVSKCKERHTQWPSVIFQKNLQQYCCEKLRFVSCLLHVEFFNLIFSGAASHPMGTFLLLRNYDKFLGWDHDVLCSLLTVMAVLTGVWLFAVILGRSHYLLFTLAAAMQPRMLVTFDEELNPLPVPVRVGLVSFTDCYVAQQISVSYSRISLIWHSR